MPCLAVRLATIQAHTPLAILTRRARARLNSSNPFSPRLAGLFFCSRAHVLGFVLMLLLSSIAYPMHTPIISMGLRHVDSCIRFALAA